MASQTDSATTDIKPTLTDLAMPVSGVVDADSQTVITKGVLQQMLSELLHGVRSELKAEIQLLRNEINRLSLSFCQTKAIRNKLACKQTLLQL